MRKILIVMLVSLSLVFAASVFAADTGGKGHPQTNCPVMGGKIDKKVYMDYQGRRVYFCCSGCVQAFKKEPDKYIKKMEDEGVVLEKTPAAQ